MQNKNLDIVKYSGNFRQQIIDVWEKSVLATHDFLKKTDFLALKEFVKTIDFNDFDVYCLIQNDEVIGFVGVAEQKIEMLFLSPSFIGLGMGKKLIEYAICVLKTDKVDVNEQNIKAVEFYLKCGFKTYERTEKDDQGKDYPLLRMKLEKANENELLLG